MVWHSKQFESPVRGGVAMQCNARHPLYRLSPGFRAMGLGRRVTGADRSDKGARVVRDGQLD